jgi:ligand-binding sensor domain-containing protein
LNYGIDYITFIKEDVLQNIWIGTFSNGMNRYDPHTQRITHYGLKDHADGFIANSGWLFYNSADGNLWVGTFDEGLYHADPYRKVFDFIPGSRVWTFNQDSANGLWLGTQTGLVFQNSRIKKFIHDPHNASSISDKPDLFIIPG